MKLVVLVVALAGCGRIDFDARATRDAGDAARADASGPLDDGLLLHLAFDSDGLLVDRAGGHTVTCSDCPVMVPGRVGDGAAHFANNDCLTIADDGSLEPAQVTLAVWVNLGMSQYSTLVGKTLHGDTDSTDSFELSVQPSPDEWGFFVTPGGGLAAATVAGWHHLAGTVDATTAALFLDGVRVAAFSASPQYTTEPVRVGCDVDNGVVYGFAQGDLDDVRVYGRALTPQEIAALAAM